MSSALGTGDGVELGALFQAANKAVSGLKPGKGDDDPSKKEVEQMKKAWRSAKQTWEKMVGVWPLPQSIPLIHFRNGLRRMIENQRELNFSHSHLL